MSTRILRVVVLTLGMMGLSIALQGQDQEDRGLKVGAKAPEFSLKDQNGERHTMSALTAKGKVALVFYRSADW